LRLAGLLVCTALATSRIGLIAHELVGHGGTAFALGARVTDVRLFWFAGGWIRYELDPPSTTAMLAIAMGGIAVELAIGVSLWIAARRRTSLAGRMICAIGAVLVVHAGWYLATGAWHGYGDGVVLYRVLGDARAAVAIGAGLVTCIAAYVAARGVLHALADTVSGTQRARVLGTIVAAALAGGAHVGLAVGELHVRRDATYGATMQPERERLIAQELARWQAAHARDGAISPADRAAEQARLDQAHRTFPFAWLLALAIAAAIVVGARRSVPGDGARPSRRMVTITAMLAGLAIGLVIAIDVVVSL
jgi:hypothetical protein